MKSKNGLMQFNGEGLRIYDNCKPGFHNNQLLVFIYFERFQIILFPGRTEFDYDVIRKQLRQDL